LWGAGVPWRSVGCGLALGAALTGCSTPLGSVRNADPGLRNSVGPATAYSQSATVAPPRIVSMADEMGQQALRDGRPEVAIEWFRKASEANPDLVTPVNGEVVALARLGRFEEAQAVVRAAQARGLQSADLNANGAWLAERLGTAAPTVAAATAAVPSPKPNVTSGQASASAQEPAAAPPALQRVRLEISNGTGVVGLARRTADQLSRDVGAPTARVRNHGHYGVEQTELRVRADGDPRAHRVLARELARSLGVSVAIVPSAELAPGVDAQLLLGADTQAPRAARVAQAYRAG
jgi:hypothetical protein